MNILKLLRCTWKQPITRNEFRRATYYVLYERVNHVLNPVYRDLKGFKALDKYEDDVDREIYQQLYEQLNAIPEIDEFYIYTNELPMYHEFEERNRITLSSLAAGYNFRNLQVSSETGVVTQLSTRIMFSDVNDLSVCNAILTSIPFALDLDIKGTIPSLIRAEFIDRKIVSESLEKDSGIDLSHYTP